MVLILYLCISLFNFIKKNIYIGYIFIFTLNFKKNFIRVLQGICNIVGYGIVKN